MIERITIHMGEVEVDVTEVFLEGLRIGWHSGKVDARRLDEVAKMLATTTQHLLEVIDGTAQDLSH